MRPIGDRTVIETLPLGECREGDEVDIRFSHQGSWKSIGEGTLLRLKPLAKGGHQIKFRSSWSGSTVQKHDVPADVVATRRRVPTDEELAADPSLAPLPERRTAVRDGVAYEATDRRTELHAALDAAALRRGMARGDRALGLGLHAADMAAASLGIAALLSSGMLSRIDED